MRTLCLNLQNHTKSVVAEQFLTFSPRVYFRSPGLVFVDMSGTAHLFGGEDAMMQEASRMAEEFYPHTTASVADTPFAAQALSYHRPSHIAPPTQEQNHLSPLPASALMQLEGLTPWPEPDAVEDMIDFFHMLGVNKLGDMRSFAPQSFKERWGETGTAVWRRIKGIERQTILPLLPTQSITEKLHFDFPISLLSFLLHSMERSLEHLFARMKGRREVAQKVRLQLSCEYGDKLHLLEVQLKTPSAALGDWLTELETQMCGLTLENPIREVEIELVSAKPSRKRQTQSEMDAESEELKEFTSMPITFEFEDDPEMHLDAEEIFLQPAAQLTRRLQTPKRMDDTQLRRLKFLSPLPISNSDDELWQTSRGRSYFIAVTPNGQYVSVFHDSLDGQYYLHGYFDRLRDRSRFAG